MSEPAPSPAATASAATPSAATPSAATAPTPAGRRAPWGLGEVLMVFGLSFVAFAAATTAVATLRGVERLAMGDQLTAHLIGCLIASAGALAITRRRGPAGWQALGLTRARPLAGLAAYAAFLAVWVPLVFVGYRALLSALGEPLPGQATMRFLIANRAAPLMPLWVLTIVVAGPLWEELMFRGLVQPLLMDRLGAWPGLVVTAIAFALIHEHPMHLLLPIGGIGLFLGWIRWRHGGVLASWLLHVLHNLVTIVVFLAWPGLFDAVFGPAR